MVNTPVIVLGTLLVGVTGYAVKITRDSNLLTNAVYLLISKMKKLELIVSTHGCAPNTLVAEGHRYHCNECGTIWEAQSPDVHWIDETLANVTTQKWDVVGHKEPTAPED